ncbi:MAG: 3-hydroxyacyl-CoA dehydrogenase family protein [Deltaproteobacteria bacterium]|nr:3-hydroxyacyl-CoA dehydrogenase family protein [Deltaproteobacteria bacterium]
MRSHPGVGRFVTPLHERTLPAMEREIRKVVVLGANGAMGSGAAETFAAYGYTTVLLARDLAKAQQGLDRVKSMAKAEKIADLCSLGSYEADLENAVQDADIVFEAVSEDMTIKRPFFERVDKARKPGSIVATVSSGLSIREMCAGLSDDFQKNFLGLHLFNPPNVIVGTEVIPHGGTDPELTRWVIDFCQKKLGREIVECADLPAFAGNRVGFKVLNECAQLAEEHGPAYIDALLGPHTGRAMAPLATIDFVGWDVHKAIVDNVLANTKDEAHAAFAMPGYMSNLLGQGHMGNKTPAKGGFFRKVKDGKVTTLFVLDPKTCDYKPAAEVAPAPLDFVTEMQKLHRVGRYRQAMQVFLAASGWEADLMRKVILGYVSYGLNRVGEVVREPRDVDRIMGFGFNWAPPTVLTDLMGVGETIAAIEKADLPVPAVLTDHAAKGGGKLFREKFVDVGRFFVGS